eukprot:NODE_2254_length_2257_cov_4.030986.p16 GENE.NODE_2254_length_2257_cov_4.030986~~NODE_2254_length_2257_cov_4.030986.p16  ORF type:complete len:50 (+),score=9.21 NODE_2254_length_2257_cov_4.030986:204-353(+)
MKRDDGCGCKWEEFKMQRDNGCMPLKPQLSPVRAAEIALPPPLGLANEA